MANSTPKVDADGQIIISNALLDMLNSFPLLASDDKFTFNTLSEDKGKAIFPTTASVISFERESITGHIYQECNYPLFIIFRTSSQKESIKITVKEWLDKLGRWLTKEPILYNGTTYVCEYPDLGERKIKEITWNTPSYLDGVNQNKSEDWVTSITIVYINEFDR